MSKITINPYLSFVDVVCKEAMMFYQQALGGELHLNTFADSPMGADMGDRIMHATLVFDGGQLMASDGMGDKKTVVGTNNSISLSPESVEEGQRIFDALSEGGTVMMPFKKQFWGDHFGMLQDKYDIQWMVNAPAASTSTSKGDST